MLQGKRIRELRLKQDMSQATLAQAIRRPDSYISALERGARTNCTAVTLERLARTLHCSSDYLIGLSDTPYRLADAPRHDTPMTLV